jgi:hypothetical protein
MRLKTIELEWAKFLDSLESQNIRDVDLIVKTGALIPGQKWRMEALKHRVFQRSGEADIGNLCRQAAEWKLDQKILDDREFSPEDVSNLNSLKFMKGFVDLLSDEDLKERFFSWTLRYKMPAHLFALCPGLTERLIESTLHDQMEADRASHLIINPNENGLEVSLRLQGGRKVSLLDESAQAHFPSGKIYTVKQIFEAFKNRDFENCPLRYFPKVYKPYRDFQGLSEWALDNVPQIVNLHEEDSYKTLPPVIQKTRAEASRYFKLPCDGHNWVVSICSKRSSLKKVINGSHTFLEIAIPDEDGIYTVYPIGKFPKTYPGPITGLVSFFKSVKGWIVLLFQVQPGRLHYPDDNCNYIHRGSTRSAVIVDRAAGKKFYRSVVKDWVKNDLLFQLGAYNCGSWASKKFTHHFPGSLLPSLKMDFFEIEMEGAIQSAFNFLRTKKNLKRRLVKTISWIMGGGKTLPTTHKNGRVEHISLMKLAPWDKEKGFDASCQMFYS